MGPLVAAGLISAAAGLGSSFLSSRSAGLSRKQIAEQNQLDRDFNAAEAQKSRDFALQMFHNENLYNDPKAVISRLMKAGVNPALAYGGFADSASGSVPSPASHSGSYASPLPDYSGIVSAGNSINQARIADAQVKLMESEAAKNLKDVSWSDALNQSLIDLQKSGIDLNYELKGVSKAQKSQIEQSTENLKQELSNLQTLGEISKETLKQAISETNIKSVESKYAESEHIANIKSTLSTVHLNDTQAWRLAASFTYEMNALQSQTRLNNSVADIHDFQNAINNAMKDLKGIGGLSDLQLQRIENELYDVYERAQNYSKSRDVSERNTDVLAFSSILGSLIGAGTQVIKGVGPQGAQVGFKY